MVVTRSHARLAHPVSGRFSPHDQINCVPDILPRDDYWSRASSDGEIDRRLDHGLGVSDADFSEHLNHLERLEAVLKLD